MSYKSRALVAAPEAVVVSTRCPAHGCPNAAAVSLESGRFACFAHAKAQPNEWPAVTQAIRDGWPRTANWNAPEKVAYEVEQAAARRAALPKRRALPVVDMATVAELLESRA